MHDEIPERHRRAVRALHSGGPAAPAALHRRVEAVRRRGRAAVPRRVETERRAPRAWRLGAVAAVATAAALALIVGLVSLGGGPSVEAVASFSLRPATQPTPAPDPSQPALLRRELERVAFPNWSAEFGWKADGARSDTVDGRRADTVFYTHKGHRISYTVIAGDPIDPPGQATAIGAGGVELHRFRDGPRDVVVFTRGGRTCVLAGDVIHDDTLVKLASWRGDGAVRF
jgi:hypothetical protein